MSQVSEGNLTDQSSMDFQRFLQQEFMKRCRNNPAYSIRGFALSLDIDHSTLSQIMRGTRPITPSMVTRLGQKFFLTPDMIDSFLQKNAAREKARKNYEQINLDMFQIIADWYHYAIFELVTIRGFKPDFEWIAKKLQISANEAELAVERLVRTGLLDTTDRKSWKQSTPLVTTIGSELTADAFRRLQRGVLQKAAAALEEIPVEFRDQSSMTMAIDSRLLPEAKEKIRDFRRSLCRFLQRGSQKDAVYQLGVSLYPLTSLEKDLHEK
ncbi:MAG: TIGR02147 family protein [Bdellovibrionales bacterium]|nr:TIGR02147 family protein [Bdellovibrionales bacterium]